MQSVFRSIVAGIWIAALSLSSNAADDPQPADAPAKVTEVTQELREKYKLDPFYAKYTDYKGYPILSSAKVSDEALLEARYLISRLLAERDDILQALINRNCRFTVMAPDEMTTD